MVSSVSAIDIVETAYDLEGQIEDWTSRCREVTQRALGEDAVTMLFTFRLPPGQKAEILAIEGDPDVVAFSRACGEAATAEMQAQVFAPHGANLVEQRLSRTNTLEFVEDRTPPMSGLKMIAGVSRDGELGMQLAYGWPGDRNVNPGDLDRHNQLMIHLSAGFRLQQGVASEETAAILDPDGRCLHAEGVAKGRDARERLRAAALAIDRARGRLRRENPREALDLWNGLVRGEWTLIDRYESDGKRLCVAVRNPPHVEQFTSLSHRERQVVHYAAFGYSNKMIGYALGLATSTVSTHLAHGMRKLGVTARVELARLMAAATLASNGNEPS